MRKRNSLRNISLALSVVLAVAVIVGIVVSLDAKPTGVATLDSTKTYTVKQNMSTGMSTLDSTQAYMVKQSIRLDSGLYAFQVTGDEAAVKIAADNVVFDCGGATIVGAGGGIGIVNDGYTNVTIKNCFVQGFAYGLKTGEYLTEYATSSFIANLVQNIYTINITSPH